MIPSATTALTETALVLDLPYEFEAEDEDGWGMEKRTDTPHSHSSRPASSTPSPINLFCVAFGVVKILLSMSSPVNDSIDSIGASGDGIICVSVSCRSVQVHIRCVIDEHRPNISVSFMPGPLS
jgi:hypothetical protein